MVCPSADSSGMRLRELTETGQLELVRGLPIDSVFTEDGQPCSLTNARVRVSRLDALRGKLASKSWARRGGRCDRPQGPGFAAGAAGNARLCACDRPRFTSGRDASTIRLGLSECMFVVASGMERYSGEMGDCVPGGTDLDLPAA